jgi:hypothetical protein
MRQLLHTRSGFISAMSCLAFIADILQWFDWSIQNRLGRDKIPPHVATLQGQPAWVVSDI